MNPSLYSFLAEPSCRAVRVEYDPDHKLNNNYNVCRLYKTLDPTISVDNLVIVPTETRHGFTVCKVVEVDLQVNYNGNDEYRWVLGKVDKAAYDALIDQDKAVKLKIGKIEENKIKRELMEAMGLAGSDLTQLSYSAVPTAATAQPLRGEEAPVAPAPSQTSGEGQS